MPECVSAEDRHISNAQRAARVLFAIVLAVICAIIASTLVHVFPSLNEGVDSKFIWFPLPTIGLASCLTYLVYRAGSSSRSVLKKDTWIIVVISAACVMSVGLILTGWNQVTDGTAVLAGDHRMGSAAFRMWFSLIVPVSAGAVEEGTLRGLLQLRARRYIGGAFSQVLTGIVFIAFHGLAALSLDHFIFLALIATVSGLLTERTKSITAAVVFHALVNGGIISIILAFR